MKRETGIDGHMTLLDSCTIANATSEMNGSPPQQGHVENQNNGPDVERIGCFAR